MIIYQPLQPYQLYMSHAYVVSRHWEACLVSQLAIQPLLLSTSASGSCGSPDYLWITWEFEIPSLGIPSNLFFTGCSHLLEVLTGYMALSLGTTKFCFYQLPLSILFLSTPPASTPQPCENNILVSGKVPPHPQCFIP